MTTFLRICLYILAACAAFGLLPMAVVVIPLSRFAPKIAAQVGVRVTGPIGLALMATILAVSLVLAASGWTPARALELGVLLYLAYNYATYTTAIAMNRLALLYIAILGLSVWGVRCSPPHRPRLQPRGRASMAKPTTSRSLTRCS